MKPKPKTAPKKPYKRHVKITDEQFAKAYIDNGRNGTRAIQSLDPEISPPTANVKAARLLVKDSVKSLIIDLDKEMEVGAKEGIIRARQLINSSNEKVATTNIWKLIEHVKGTPVQRQIVKSTRLNISLGDLTDTNKDIH